MRYRSWPTTSRLALLVSGGLIVGCTPFDREYRDTEAAANKVRAVFEGHAFPVSHAYYGHTRQIWLDPEIEYFQFQTNRAAIDWLIARFKLERDPYNEYSPHDLADWPRLPAQGAELYRSSDRDPSSTPISPIYALFYHRPSATAI